MVADVDHYHEFVPWCQRSEVLVRRDMEYVEAELEVGFKLFVERCAGHTCLQAVAVVGDRSCLCSSCGTVLPASVHLCVQEQHDHTTCCLHHTRACACALLMHLCRLRLLAGSPARKHMSQVHLEQLTEVLSACVTLFDHPLCTWCCALGPHASVLPYSRSH